MHSRGQTRSSQFTRSRRIKDASITLIIVFQVGCLCLFGNAYKRSKLDKMRREDVENKVAKETRKKAVFVCS